MPFYEYECQSCKFYSEVMQKITDAPLKKCPSCGKNALKKLVSAPVFRLKGSGWYETDFKSDQEKKRNLAVEADAKTEGAGESKATEDKAGEGAKAAESTKPAESSKPAEAKPAPAAEKAGARKSIPITRSSKSAARKPAAARPRSKPAARAKASRKGRR